MKHQRIPTFAAAVVAAALAAAPALAFAEKPWLHLRVVDSSDETKVSVNLPLAAVEALAESMGDEILDEATNALADGNGEASGVDVELDDIRAFWQALRDDPGAWIEVDDDGEGLRGRVDGDEVRFEATGDGELSIRFPVAVGDALFGGGEGEFDFAGAVRSLADHEGDIVSVRGDDAEVRIWIGPQ